MFLLYNLVSDKTFQVLELFKITFEPIIFVYTNRKLVFLYQGFAQSLYVS